MTATIQERIDKYQAALKEQKAERERNEREFKAEILSIRERRARNLIEWLSLATLTDFSTLVFNTGSFDFLVEDRFFFTVDMGETYEQHGFRGYVPVEVAQGKSLRLSLFFKPDAIINYIVCLQSMDGRYQRHLQNQELIPFKMKDIPDRQNMAVTITADSVISEAKFHVHFIPIMKKMLEFYEPYEGTLGAWVAEHTQAEPLWVETLELQQQAEQEQRELAYQREKEERKQADEQYYKEREEQRKEQAAAREKERQDRLAMAEGMLEEFIETATEEQLQHGIGRILLEWVTTHYQSYREEYYDEEDY